MGSHTFYSCHILAVDGFIPETSDKADHVTCAHTLDLAKGVLPLRSVTESGAGISELHDLRIQEDNVVLPFLLRRRTVRRCDRHPAPVVIPIDLEVFLFGLCSPFVADHDRVGDFRLAQVLRVVHERHHHKRRFVVPRLYKTGFEIGCARVDEDKAVDALLILEGFQQYPFQRDSRSGQIAGMGVPRGQTIGSVGELYKGGRSRTPTS